MQGGGPTLPADTGEESATQSRGGLRRVEFQCVEDLMAVALTFPFAIFLQGFSVLCDGVEGESRAGDTVWACSAEWRGEAQRDGTEGKGKRENTG